MRERESNPSLKVKVGCLWPLITISLDLCLVLEAYNSYSNPDNKYPS